MARRVHVDRVSPGKAVLSPEQAHHLRDVLRLTVGDEIEVFDSEGCAGAAKIVCTEPDLELLIENVQAGHCEMHLTVYSAVPKGDRADWLIEKLSELGVTRFVPLRTQRSVVHPEGKGKLDRWERIAIESAKQCRRTGVMKIQPLMALSDALISSHSVPGAAVRRLYLSTLPDAPSIVQSLEPRPGSLDLFIGPEGGWSAEEIGHFIGAGLTGARLTTTILRIETAAVAAASVIATVFAKDHATT